MQQFSANLYKHTVISRHAFFIKFFLFLFFSLLPFEIFCSGSCDICMYGSFPAYYSFTSKLIFVVLLVFPLESLQIIYPLGYMK